MKREIVRIEPASAIRIGFFLGLLAGVVVGLLEVIVFKSLSSNPASSSLLPPEAAQFVTMSGATIILLAVFLGLLFSLIFACAGAITAVFYNMIARLFGGLELHISGDQEPAAGRRESESAAEDEEDA